MRSKKRLLTIISLVLISLFLTGCGTQNQPAITEPTEENEAKETKIVKHAMGETEIPVNPERIAVLFARDVEALLVLGVTPIAASAGGEFDTVPEFSQALENAGVIDLGEQRTPNLEKLLEVEPDLIILTEWHEIYDEVSKIAPTVKLDTLGWDRFNELASILGKEAEAAEFKEKHEKKLTEAKSLIKEHVEENATASMVMVFEKVINVGEKEGVFNEFMYNRLGFNPPKDMETINGEISVEGLLTLNPDYIFARIHHEEYYNELFSTGVIQNINAVKNNRVYPLHWTLFRNIYGEYLMLDIIMEAIAGQ